MLCLLGLLLSPPVLGILLQASGWAALVLLPAWVADVMAVAPALVVALPTLGFVALLADEPWLPWQRRMPRANVRIEVARPTTIEATDTAETTQAVAAVATALVLEMDAALAARPLPTPRPTVLGGDGAFELDPEIAALLHVVPRRATPARRHNRAGSRKRSSSRRGAPMSRMTTSPV